MNHRLVHISFIILTAHLGFAQEINIYKTFGGYQFERDSIPISPKMVEELMKINPDAYAEFRSARNNYGIASGLKFAGGLMIVVPVVSVIGGGNPEWLLAAGGLGLILASIPLNSAFRHRALNALDLYNASQRTGRIRTNFYLMGLGGKLTIRF